MNIFDKLSISFRNSPWINIKQGYNIWLTWLLIASIVFLIHCLTLTISPIVYPDEAMIIEYGRITLEPNTDWSILWSMKKDGPLFMPFYLGTTLQELAFRFSNFSMIGPRLSSLVGGLTAATTALGWLLSCKTPKHIGLLLSTIFLLDPLFVFSYRSGRVDCWVIALCFGACWLLRTAKNNIENTKLTINITICSASLAVTAFFIWPSAVIVYPLVIVEIVRLLYESVITFRHWQQAFKLIAALVLGGIITLIIIVIPIWDKLFMSFTNLTTISGGSSNISNRLFSLLNFAPLVSSFTISGLLPVVTVATLFFRRDRFLFTSALFATTVVLMTNPYHFRVVYLLPYFVGIIASLYNHKNARYNNRKNFYLVAYISLIILLIWASVISLLLRPSLALTQQEPRDYTTIVDVAKSEIGINQKVYIPSYQFYYAGRLLGWKLFAPFQNDGTIWNDNQSRLFLEKVDHAIYPTKFNQPGQVGYETLDGEPDIFEKSGLKFRKVLLSQNLNIHARFFADRPSLGGGLPYGPYNLYSRFSNK